MTDDKEAGWAKIKITQKVDDLIQYGPSINIGIAPVPFVGSGMTTVCAQIDTGAGGSALSPRIANRLNLSPIDKGEIHIAGMPVLVAPYYRVRLFLPSTDIEVDVVGLATLDPPHDILIGRDILANCRLIVDFVSGVTGLHIKSAP